MEREYPPCHLGFLLVVVGSFMVSFRSPPVYFLENFRSLFFFVPKERAHNSTTEKTPEKKIPRPPWFLLYLTAALWRPGAGGKKAWGGFTTQPPSRSLVLNRHFETPLPHEIFWEGF